MNTPDKWCLVKVVTPKETIIKVLASWSGGYLEGQAWRLNSGITKLKETKKYYDFYGTSGSIYRCYKAAQGINTISAGILVKLKTFAGVSETSVKELKRYLREKN